ncbi:MAG: DnaD domain protein [Bacilli bacterium]|nr:DnaD domain protein [Bacilli bacterium]
MKKLSLLPADLYQVINKSFMSEQDKTVLTMLYMPIIGSLPISLYLMLYNELSLSNYLSKEATHHHLMTNLSVSLELIKEARIKLEGIGLLKTYVKKDEINSYIYELYSPLSCYEFFTHPIFNMVLFNNVGKEEYNRIISYFKIPSLDLKEYEDITMPFDMTFKSYPYTEFELQNVNIINKNKLKLNYELDFDFDLLSSLIPKNIFNEKALNKSSKELIVNLSFLYDLDPINMADLIKISLNDKGLIEKETLRKNVRKFYQYNNENRLPSLLFKSEVEYLKSPDGDNSRRGRILKVFESTSPYEFLKSKYKGVRPTSRDMNILEMLLIELKLNASVVNVLIDYVLKSNNNKLTRSYVETIAGQWKRKGIETAKEAMEIAEKEHKKYRKETNSKKEVTPLWFNEKQEKESTTKEEQEELRELLKEFN